MRIGCRNCGPRAKNAFGPVPPRSRHPEGCLPGRAGPGRDLREVWSQAQSPAPTHLPCEENTQSLRARTNERQMRLAFAPLIEIETENCTPSHLFIPRGAGKCNVSSGDVLSAIPAR